MDMNQNDIKLSSSLTATTFQVRVCCMWPVAIVSDSRNTDIHVITGHSVGQFCSRNTPPAVLWKAGFRNTSRATSREAAECGRLERMEAGAVAVAGSGPR